MVLFERLRLTLIRCVALVAVLAAGVLSTVNRSQAQSATQWHAMVHACEAVIAAQDTGPLAEYAPAPYASSMPGLREEAVFNGAGTLIAIATEERGVWTSCIVREQAEPQTEWRDVGESWTYGFERGFPRLVYEWISWSGNPDRPFLGAVKCQAEGPAILVAPGLSADAAFQVEVSSDAEMTAQFCAA